MSQDWIVLRADVDSLDSLAGDPVPLGRSRHVRKLLDETFRGMKWSAESGFWQRDSVAIELSVPGQDEVVSLHVSIHCDDVDHAIRILAPAFRKLNRRSNWSVFDVATNERIDFPGTRTRSVRNKKRSLALVEVPLSELPSSGLERRVLYVSLSPEEDVGDVLDELEGLARAEPEITGWAVIEERARLSFPDGTLFQGISFKTEHPVVEATVRQMNRVVGELLKDGRFCSLHRELPAIASATAWKY